MSQLQITRSYFRSKIIARTTSSNAYVSAALPVFSILDRLYINEVLPSLPILQEHIKHELHAFLSQLQSCALSQETNAIAYYVLAATIDELIAKNYLRVQAVLTDFTALTPATADLTDGPETQVFNIIEKIRQHPSQYLDLLELIYYCLISGFEGKYHQHTDGRLVLDNLIEDIYQLIAQHRVPIKHQLFSHKTLYKDIGKEINYIYLIGAILVSVAVTIVCFIGDYTFLHSKSRFIQAEYALLANADNL